MNLIIDIGNTFVKLAVFDNNTIIDNYKVASENLLITLKAINEESNTISEVRYYSENDRESSYRHKFNKNGKLIEKNYNQYGKYRLSVKTSFKYNNLGFSVIFYILNKINIRLYFSVLVSYFQ